MVFGTEQRIGALVKDEHYYVRVDAFNENGITEGVKLYRSETCRQLIMGFILATPDV